MRDVTVSRYLGELAERTPAPGGGAVAALHAAQAAGLLAMVGRYSAGKRHAVPQQTIQSLVGEADALSGRALQLAEDDAAAFMAVADAYQLPNGTDEERATRSAAIAGGLVGASAPPAAVIELARRLIELAEVLLPIGNRNVIADLAAAAEAARAAAVTARVNVEVNLRGIKDDEARGRLAAVAAGVDELVAGADQVTATVRKEIS